MRKTGLKASVKTSGETGLYLFIPCERFRFPEARKIAVNICEGIHALIPKISTTEVSISMRGNKLYMDPKQNDKDTIAAAYSLRPFKIPALSAPLEWKEVIDTLDPSAFTIRTILKFLERQVELWKNILDNKVATTNSRALSKF